LGVGIAEADAGSEIASVFRREQRFPQQKQPRAKPAENRWFPLAAFAFCLYRIPHTSAPVFLAPFPAPFVLPLVISTNSNSNLSVAACLSSEKTCYKNMLFFAPWPCSFELESV
jgi:hypothetical protein